MPDQGKVIDLPYSPHWRTEQCLGAAGKADLKEVLIVGFGQDGTFRIFYGDDAGAMVPRDALWLAAQAQSTLLG